MTASGDLLSGAALFARYAFPPNELGYCGPAGSQVLLESGGGGGGGDAEIAHRARQFDGAWPYLEIIAAGIGVRDPLDPRVVEAYWIGNELLDRVDTVDCLGQLQVSFRGQATSGMDVGSSHAVTEAVPHHGFHVFTVYPWVRMLRSERDSGYGAANDAVAVNVLDRCRIRWGEIIEVGDEHLQVSSRPLTWDGLELGLGPAQQETARWADAGRSLVNAAAPGQQVALHWDWACDRLSARQLGMLEQQTERQLARTNRWLASVRGA